MTERLKAKCCIRGCKKKAYAYTESRPYCKGHYVMKKKEDDSGFYLRRKIIRNRA